MKGEGEPMVELKKDPEVLNELYVIDFDRTLVDSTRLVELLFVAVDMAGFGNLLHDLEEMEIEKRGKSFSPLKELKTMLSANIGTEDPTVRMKVGEDGIERIREVFVTLGKDIAKLPHDEGGFFEPGAQELLDSTEGRRMIFTYGVDHEWQTWKLEVASLLNEHHAITTEAAANGKPIPKPRLLARMRSSEGYFEMQSAIADDEPIRAKRLRMVDDKMANLEGLPEGVEGYLYLSENVESELNDEDREEYQKFFERNPGVHPLRHLLDLAQDTLI